MGEVGESMVRKAGKRVDGILNQVDERHEAYDRMGDKKKVEGDTWELRGS